MKRILCDKNIITAEPSAPDPFAVKSDWDAHWITHPNAAGGVVNYSLTVKLPDDTIVHLSASDRYILYCDGELCGRGPAAGGHNLWFYDSYSFPAGEHTLLAVVYSYTVQKPWSQVSFGNRFILTAESYNDLLATGIAGWQTAADLRYSFIPSHSPQNPTAKAGTGARFMLNFGKSTSKPENAAILERGHFRNAYAISSDTPNLVPNRLLPMTEREIPLGIEEEILPHTDYEKLIPLDNYYCGYPLVKVSGGKGAEVSIELAESLYERGSTAKDNRSEYKDKEFRGIGDNYLLCGGDAVLTPPDWLSGRYMRIKIKTADEAVEIHSVSLTETRYPFEPEKLPEGGFIGELSPILLRTLQMCMHSTYMDCPHFERLMYLGDTRIQMLISYALSPDTRLAQQSIALLASAAHFADGKLPCCYPVTHSRTIPGFSLYFAAILYDYATHTGDIEFIKPYLNTARSIIDSYLPQSDSEIAKTPSGWNFYDWANSWQSGIAPEQDGFCPEFNAQLVYTLMLQARLERLCGEPELAARWERYARGIKCALLKRTFTKSEHYLCFMLLSDALSQTEEQALLNELLSTGGETLSVYFSHYLFEVYTKFRLYDKMDEYLEKWRFVLENNMFTVPEELSGHTRSDCHAWGAHPLYHYMKAASV